MLSAGPLLGAPASHQVNRFVGTAFNHRITTAEEQALLCDGPVPLGRLWPQHVNQPQTDAELEAIRRSVARGRPFGGDAWCKKVTRQLGLEHTIRPRGRPRKQPHDPLLAAARQK